eukprot:10979045-Alexandrium_andersonii.AAC.1
MAPETDVHNNVTLAQDRPALANPSRAPPHRHFQQGEHTPLGLRGQGHRSQGHGHLLRAACQGKTPDT